MNTATLITLGECINAYGDNWQAYYAMAEIVHAEQTGKLPTWGLFIERIERYNNGNVVIHRDKKRMD